MSFDGVSICYEHAGKLRSIPLDKVRIIGELTTPDGPLLDDYFICSAGVYGALGTDAEGRSVQLTGTEPNS